MKFDLTSATMAGAVALLWANPAAAADVPVASTATAATATVGAPAVAVIEAAAPATVLRAGTEVPLRTREELTTEKKQLRVGARVQLEVASNVEAGGVIVIPAGTPATAEVTDVRNKGMWGKSGYINSRIISMRLGERVVRLSGTFDDMGVTGTAGVVAAVALVPVVGFFTTGTSARIPSGAAVKGFLDEDIAFRAPVVETPAAVTATVAQH